MHGRTKGIVDSYEWKETVLLCVFENYINRIELTAKSQRVIAADKCDWEETAYIYLMTGCGLHYFCICLLLLTEWLDYYGFDIPSELTRGSISGGQEWVCYQNLEKGQDGLVTRCPSVTSAWMLKKEKNNRTKNRSKVVFMIPDFLDTFNK